MFALVRTRIMHMARQKSVYFISSCFCDGRKGKQVRMLAKIRNESHI